MTVSETYLPPKRYTCNGATTEFPTTFPFLDEDHLVVTFVPDDGDPEVLTLATNYTVTGGDGDTGTVTTIGADSPYDDGDLVIDRDTPLDQEIDLRATGSFDPDEIEEGLDKTTMQMQERSVISDRALRLPATADADVDTELPEPAAGAFFAWNADGDALIHASCVSGVTASAFGASLVDDAHATEARDTLGLGTAAVEDVGTDAGDVVQLAAGGKLPAVDGSLLTSLAPSSIWHKINLFVRATSVTDVVIQADEVVASGLDETIVMLRDVDVTAQITASGANGLDQGAEAADTLYYVWLIYNPTTETAAGLLSVLSTAPNLPSGYTYQRLVDEVYNTASSDLLLSWRWDDEKWFEDPQVVYANQQLTTSYVMYDLPEMVPEGCNLLYFECSGDHTVQNSQLISPDPTAKMELTMFEEFAAGNFDQGPVGECLSVNGVLRHTGRTHIFARANYNANIASLGLHVWGYRLPR